jgi:hypothetical protein
MLSVFVLEIILIIKIFRKVCLHARVEPLTCESCRKARPTELCVRRMLCELSL